MSTNQRMYLGAHLIMTHKHETTETNRMCSNGHNVSYQQKFCPACGGEAKNIKTLVMTQIRGHELAELCGFDWDTFHEASSELACSRQDPMILIPNHRGYSHATEDTEGSTLIDGDVIVTSIAEFVKGHKNELGAMMEHGVSIQVRYGLVVYWS